MGGQKWSTVPADRGGDPPAVLDTGLNNPQPPKQGAKRELEPKWRQKVTIWAPGLLCWFIYDELQKSLEAFQISFPN